MADRLIPPVHEVGPWESYPGGVAARRCVNCGEVQMLRFQGDNRYSWTRDGDRVRMTLLGIERTDAPVTCERAA